MDCRRQRARIVSHLFSKTICWKAQHLMCSSLLLPISGAAFQWGDIAHPTLRWLNSSRPFLRHKQKGKAEKCVGGSYFVVLHVPGSPISIASPLLAPALRPSSPCSSWPFLFWHCTLFLAIPLLPPAFPSTKMCWVPPKSPTVMLTVLLSQDQLITYS